MEEMALYDIKAEFDLIQNVTNVDKVTYLGQGQGAFLMFYALVELE